MQARHGSYKPEVGYATRRGYASACEDKHALGLRHLRACGTVAERWSKGVSGPTDWETDRPGDLVI